MSAAHWERTTSITRLSSSSFRPGRLISGAYGRPPSNPPNTFFLRAVGKALLKEDEVQTILVEVEAVLNSRPLVADSSNPNDGEAITPAHFLVGTTLAALPPGSAPPYPDTIYNAGSLYQASNDGFGETGPVTIYRGRSKELIGQRNRN